MQSHVTGCMSQCGGFLAENDFTERSCRTAAERPCCNQIFSCFSLRNDCFFAVFFKNQTPGCRGTEIDREPNFPVWQEFRGDCPDKSAIAFRSILLPVGFALDTVIPETSAAPYSVRRYLLPIRRPDTSSEDPVVLRLTMFCNIPENWLWRDCQAVLYT